MRTGEKIPYLVLRVIDVATLLVLLWSSSCLGADCADYDMFEPNDTYQQATFISTNGDPIQEYICNLTDRDWHIFYAHQGNAYQIYTSRLGPGVKTAIFLYDPSAGEILQVAEPDADTGEASLSYSFTSAAAYYFEVRPSSSSAYGEQADYNIQCIASTFTPSPTRTPTLTPTESPTSTQTPTATWTHKPTCTATPTPSSTPSATPTGTPCSNDDIYEPNDTMQEAKGPLVPYAEYVQLFCSQTDKDWFYIDRMDDRWLHIQTRWLQEGVDTILFVYRSDGFGTIAINDDDPARAGTSDRYASSVIIPPPGAHNEPFYVVVAPSINHPSKEDSLVGKGSLYQLYMSYYSSPPVTYTPTPYPSGYAPGILAAGYLDTRLSSSEYTHTLSIFAFTEDVCMTVWGLYILETTDGRSHFLRSIFQGDLSPYAHSKVLVDLWSFKANYAPNRGFYLQVNP